MEKLRNQKKYLFIVAVFLAGIAFMLISSKGDSQEVKILKTMLPEQGKITQISEFAGDTFMQEHFPAIKKAYMIDGRYVGFLAETVGYSGPMSILIAIETKAGTNDDTADDTADVGTNDDTAGKGIVTGIRILSHTDTPEYADPIMESWFLERFRQKDMEVYLSLVTLDAQNENEIIQVTGATISSQAVVNGVNSAIGAWQYLTSGRKFAAVSSFVPQEMWDKDENSFTIVWPEGERRINVDELMQYPSHVVDATLHKTTGTKTDMQVEGPYLSDILSNIGLDLKKYQGIGVTGRDGYYTLIDHDKLREPIVLAFLINGKELKSDNKPARLVLPSQMGPYWVQMVSKIDLYDAISPKDISALYSFDALTKDIEPYYYEYYGSKDKSIEVGKILSLFDEVDPKGFFTMSSYDGLEKNETISMVRDRYFIKCEGENAPMNIAPNFKLGMNVKEMAWFSTTKDTVFFPEKMKEISRTKTVDGQEWMSLEDALLNAGLMFESGDLFFAESTDGNTYEIAAADIGTCYLTAKKGQVSLMHGEKVVMHDFLCIKKK